MILGVYFCISIFIYIYIYVYAHKHYRGVEASTREINRRDLNAADTPARNEIIQQSRQNLPTDPLTNDVTRNLHAFPYIARSAALWGITASIQE